MIDVKKKRVIKEEEIGVSKCSTRDMAYFGFSQDEEYLILGYMQMTKDHEVIDVYIVRIGSFSEFFTGKPFKVEAVLHLVELDFKMIMGVHMNR